MSGSYPWGRRRHLVRSERGSALPLLALALVLAGVLAVGLGRLGADTVAVASAVTAADAAALAAAGEGEGAARRVAERNGARLVRVTWIGPEVEVEVELGPARATARARRTWSAAPSAPVARR